MPVLLGTFLLCCLPFHNDDAALYAWIAKQMVLSGDYSTIIVDGEPWLDKPHLHFWIHAAFFEILGISEWSFRLPLVAASVGVLVYLWYSVAEALDVASATKAVLLAAATLYTVLVVLEGRVEPFATLALVGSLYHGRVWLTIPALRHTLAVGLYLTLGMLTKGLFVPLIAIGTLLLIATKEGVVLRYIQSHLLIVIGFFAVLLLPELWALRMQFGDTLVQPKYGEEPVTAVYWFLWESQVGRFFSGRDNTGQGGDLFYYFHTSLWALFPIGILLWAAFWRSLRRGIAFFDSVPSTVLLLFLIPFSLSSFQLPHYLVIMAPFVAWLIVEQGWPRWFSVFSGSVSLIVAVITVVGSAYLQMWSWSSPVIAAIVMVLFYYAYVFFVDDKAFIAHFFAGIIIQVVLVCAVVPAVTALQGERLVADYINHIEEDSEVYLHGHASRRLDLYLDRPIRMRTLDNGIPDRLDSDALHLFTRLDSSKVDLVRQRFDVLLIQPHVAGESDISVLWSEKARESKSFLFAVCMQKKE